MTKIRECPKIFLMIFRDEIMGYRVIKISVAAFWQREIFDFKVVKYLDESKSLKNTVVYLPLLTDKP